MKYRNIAIKYFNLFSNKDIDKLKLLFAENITLRDWEISKKGIENVIDANNNIFESCNDIKVKILEIYEIERTIIAEIKIIIDQKLILLVVDVITFDEKDKICKIRAYKGN